MPGPRVLLIDNDDSYTYNLFHLIGALTGRPPQVVGHDDPVDPRRYSHLVISPGPGHPADRRRVGRLAELIMTTDRPVLGVCLGHQLLGLVFGGSVVPVLPHHGLISAVRHDGRGVFAGLPQDFRAVRYHSLAVVDPPPDLEVTATAADDGVIMGLRHRTRDLHGVQFHPESIAAESGREIMINFLALSSFPEPVPPCPEPVEGHHIALSGGSHALRQAQGTEGQAQGTEVRLLTRELPWRDPEDVFVAHYADRPTACWLDSGVGGRYSIMGAPEGPRGTVLSRTGVADPAGGGHRDDPDRPGRCPVPVPRRLRRLPWAIRTPTARSEAEFAYLERFLVFDHDHRRAHAAAVAHPGETVAAESWLDRAAGSVAATPPADEPSRQGVLGPITDPDPAWYPAAYDRVQSYLRSGDSYEVNLTFQRRIAYRGDHVELYRQLRRANPAPYAAFLRLPAATVLSSSPERFLRVDDHGVVQARPIKGTAPRHPDPATDATIKERLRTETKTVAENLMITDLLRHDLGRSCRLGSVRVPELMAVESYRTVHQLVTTVEGDLADGVDAVDCRRRRATAGLDDRRPQVAHAGDHRRGRVLTARDLRRRARLLQPVRRGRPERGDPDHRRPR